MIRLWKLGSLEHKVIPSEESYQILYDRLAHIKGVPIQDIVWGPDIECQVISNTNDKEVDISSLDIAKYLENKFSLRYEAAHEAALTICGMIKEV